MPSYIKGRGLDGQKGEGTSARSIKAAPARSRTPKARLRATPPGRYLFQVEQNGQAQHPRQVGDPHPEHEQHQGPAAAQAEEAVAQPQGQGPGQPRPPEAHQEADGRLTLGEACPLQGAELVSPGQEQHPGADKLAVLWFGEISAITVRSAGTRLVLLSSSARLERRPPSCNWQR